MAERIVEATADHKAFLDDLKQTFVKHVNKVPPEEILALSAYYCGMVLAFQDQTKMTKDRALDIIEANIEKGNEYAIGSLFKETLGNA